MKKIILLGLSLYLSPVLFGQTNPRIESSRSSSRQVNADWNATSGPALILNKPNIISPVNPDWNATSGPAMILNKPTFSNSPQINSDWNATSGISMILNKPVIPAAQVNSDWNATTGIARILNKPTIPAPQVNADWNATSGLAVIANKPASLPTILKINTVTADYTLRSSDLGAIIVFNPPATTQKTTLTIPIETSTSEIVPVGAQISGVSAGAGSYVVISGAAGVTISNTDNAFRTRDRGAKFTLTKYALNVWNLEGDLFSLETIGYLGDSVTLRAVIDRSATGPFTFKWTKNGVDISGATLASLVLADIQATDAGIYSVTVTNSAGQRSSENFNLIVK